MLLASEDIKQKERSHNYVTLVENFGADPPWHSRTEAHSKPALQRQKISM